MPDAVHAVLITGYGVLKDQKYWLVKNRYIQLAESIDHHIVIELEIIHSGSLNLVTGLTAINVSVAIKSLYSK